jgi:hypothetical protein
VARDGLEQIVDRYLQFADSSAKKANYKKARRYLDRAEVVGEHTDQILAARIRIARFEDEARAAAAETTDNETLAAAQSAEEEQRSADERELEAKLDTETDEKRQIDALTAELERSKNELTLLKKTRGGRSRETANC